MQLNIELAKLQLKLFNAKGAKESKMESASAQPGISSLPIERGK